MVSLSVPPSYDLAFTWIPVCCNPPLPEQVLTSIIRASLKNKPGKGLKAWRCERCGATVANSVPAPSNSLHAVVLRDRDQIREREREAPIVILDDDEDSHQRVGHGGRRTLGKHIATPWLSTMNDFSQME